MFVRMRLQRLRVRESDLIRSSMAVTSVSHCVKLLVENALNAGAKLVQVGVNLDTMTVSVCDNGHGIPGHQLALVGNRYFTGWTENDLELNGYKGESLANISAVSKWVKIKSRCSSESVTWSCLRSRHAILNRGNKTISSDGPTKRGAIGQVCNTKLTHSVSNRARHSSTELTAGQRTNTGLVRRAVTQWSSCGTEVKVGSLFTGASMRNRTTCNRDPHHMTIIYETMILVAMGRPSVGFTLTDLKTNNTMLNLTPCGSYEDRFCSAMGDTVRVDRLETVTCDTVEATAFISFGIPRITRLRKVNIFIDGCLSIKNSFHSFVNKELQKCSVTEQFCVVIFIECSKTAYRRKSEDKGYNFLFLGKMKVLKCLEDLLKGLSAINFNNGLTHGELPNVPSSCRQISESIAGIDTRNKHEDIDDLPFDRESPLTISHTSDSLNVYSKNPDCTNSNESCYKILNPSTPKRQCQTALSHNIPLKKLRRSKLCFESVICIDKFSKIGSCHSVRKLTLADRLGIIQPLAAKDTNRPEVTYKPCLKFPLVTSVGARTETKPVLIDWTKIEEQQVLKPYLPSSIINYNGHQIAQNNKSFRNRNDTVQDKSISYCHPLEPFQVSSDFLQVPSGRTHVMFPTDTNLIESSSHPQSELACSNSRNMFRFVFESASSAKTNSVDSHQIYSQRYNVSSPQSKTNSLVQKRWSFNLPSNPTRSVDLFWSPEFPILFRKREKTPNEISLNNNVLHTTFEYGQNSFTKFPAIVNETPARQKNDACYDNSRSRAVYTSLENEIGKLEMKNAFHPLNDIENFYSKSPNMCIISNTIQNNVTNSLSSVMSSSAAHGQMSARREQSFFSFGNNTSFDKNYREYSSRKLRANSRSPVNVDFLKTLREVFNNLCNDDLVNLVVSQISRPNREDNCSITREDTEKSSKTGNDIRNLFGEKVRLTKSHAQNVSSESNDEAYSNNDVCLSGTSSSNERCSGHLSPDIVSIDAPEGEKTKEIRESAANIKKLNTQDNGEHQLDNVGAINTSYIATDNNNESHNNISQCSGSEEPMCCTNETHTPLEDNLSNVLQDCSDEQNGFLVEASAEPCTLGDTDETAKLHAGNDECTGDVEMSLPKNMCETINEPGQPESVSNSDIKANATLVDSSAENNNINNIICQPALQNRSSPSSTNCVDIEVSSKEWSKLITNLGRRVYVNLPSGLSTLFTPPSLSLEPAVAISAPKHSNGSLMTGIIFNDNEFNRWPRRSKPSADFVMTHGFSPFVSKRVPGQLHAIMPAKHSTTDEHDVHIERPVKQTTTSKNPSLFNEECKISSESLANIVVFGQVDRKFIAGCIDEDVVVLFDQHAVSERIQLEKILKVNGVPSASCQLKSAPLRPPLAVTLSHTAGRVLKQCTAATARCGFQLVFNSYEECGGAGEITVWVHSVTSCLAVRRRSPPTADLAQQVTTLLHQLAQQLAVTGSRSCAIVPSQLLDLYKSQACHSAVRFGDRLSLLECRQLIDQLKQCQLPLQCAHGRPSVIPLAVCSRTFSGQLTQHHT